MIRVRCGSPITLIFRFLVDELPTDPDGEEATVTVTNPTGTVVSTGLASKEAIGVYVYQMATPVVPTVYTAVAAGDFAAVAASVSETVDVVSDRLFSLAALRGTEAKFSDTEKWPTDLLETVRVETEDEAERIMCRSFIGRYRDLVITGGGDRTLMLDTLPIRQIVSATSGGAELDVADVGFDALGYVYYAPGWASGLSSIRLGLIYGETRIPGDLQRAALQRARTRLFDFNSGIPDRALSFTAAEGGTYALSTAGRAGAETGIPDVDAVYKRYSYAVGIY